MRNLGGILALSLCMSGAMVRGADTLLMYVGAACKPPAAEAAKLYEKKSGIKIDLSIGASDFVLSQMKLAKQGDIYFPSCSGSMEKAKREGDVFADSEKAIAYLAPSINVVRGNPRNIRTLQDLSKHGLRVAIGDPESTCIGAYAVEIIENAFTAAPKVAFQSNLVKYTESCEKTATALTQKLVDAVIGWSVFEHWAPRHIQAIQLPANQILRIGYIPIAISKFTKDRNASQDFIDFMAGPEGSKIFARYKYFVSAEEAIASVGAPKPVGGTPIAPDSWIKSK
jgi:molybdate transport system substrate-binding protein